MNVDDDQNAMADFVTEFTSMVLFVLFDRVQWKQKFHSIVAYEAFLDSQISEIDQYYLQVTRLYSIAVTWIHLENV